jgi:hypothetical protein
VQCEEVLKVEMVEFAIVLSQISISSTVEDLFDQSIAKGKLRQRKYNYVNVRERK